MTAADEGDSVERLCSAAPQLSLHTGIARGSLVGIGAPAERRRCSAEPAVWLDLHVETHSTAVRSHSAGPPPCMPDTPPDDWTDREAVEAWLCIRPKEVCCVCQRSIRSDRTAIAAILARATSTGRARPSPREGALRCLNRRNASNSLAP